MRIKKQNRTSPSDISNVNNKIITLSYRFYTIEKIYFNAQARTKKKVFQTKNITSRHVKQEKIS